MNDRNVSTYQMFKGVQTFGRSNRTDFVTTSLARTLFTRLDGIIEDLDTAKISQLRESMTKQTLVGEIHLDLVNVARTAREVEKDLPNFAAPYQLPTNTSEEALTTHCDSVLARLEPREDDTPEQTAAKQAALQQFLRYELEEDFVTDLSSQRAELERLNNTKRENNQEGVSGTTAIDVLIREGKSIVKRLNAIMHNKYTRVPEKLRAWKSASHIERPPKKKKGQEPPPPPSPPPQAPS